MIATQEHWNYRNPVHIHFGAGRLAELPALVAGRRALVVTTPGFTRRGLTARVRDLLAGADVLVLDTVQPNPDLAGVERDCRDLVGERVDVLVGLGGGSAIDTAKALSLLLRARAPELLLAHFETGAALPDVEPLPLIAVPTTAGTGSEVTPFATIWDHLRGKKYSLAGPRLYPQAALLDPALTISLPAEETIATGLDALSQGFEAIWNRNATPITTLYAGRAIALARAALTRLVASPDDMELRAQMMEASLLAGLAISHTRTALAHSISYPITARYGVPHGLACGFTLPALLEFNAACDDGRLATLARQLGAGTVEALREALQRLLEALGIKRLLGRYLASAGDLIDRAPEMLTPGRADNNLRPAQAADVAAILAVSLGELGLVTFTVNRWGL